MYMADLGVSVSSNETQAAVSKEAFVTFRKEIEPTRPMAADCTKIEGMGFLPRVQKGIRKFVKI